MIAWFLAHWPAWSLPERRSPRWTRPESTLSSARLRRSLGCGLALVWGCGLAACSGSDAGSRAPASTLGDSQATTPDADDGATAATDSAEVGGDASRDVRIDDAPPSDAVADGGDDGLDTGCQVLSVFKAAGSVRSADYSGTDQDYATAQSLDCGSTPECVDACKTAGGSADSCAAGATCVTGLVNYCLQPNYWVGAARALSQSTALTDAAVVLLSDPTYHDALVFTDFGLSAEALPEDVTVRGVAFSVRLASAGAEAADQSVRVLKGGVAVGVDQARPTARWARDLTEVTFGGPNDLWGVGWTAAELRASGFGLSLSARHAEATGNERGYVSSPKVTVYYTRGCR